MVVKSGSTHSHPGVDISSSVRERLASLYHTGRYHDAVAEAIELIRRYPRNPFGYQLAGIAYRKLGQGRKAVVFLDKAQSLAPDNADILNSLARARIAEQEYLEACHCLAKVLDHNPSNGTARMLMCRVKSVLGDPVAAIEHGREAVRLVADNHEAHYYLCSAFRLAVQLPEAIGSGRRALELRLARPPGGNNLAKEKTFDVVENEKVLWSVLTELAKIGVHAFPTAGTLLGIVREGELLPYDKDLDIGLPFSEMPSAVRHLERSGWIEDRSYPRLVNPRSFLHKATGCSMDLCGLTWNTGRSTVFGGFWLEGVPRAWNRIIQFPATRLEQAPGPSGTIWQLTKPELWLEALYGDWRTPDPHFDTIICARNLVGFSLLTECFALQRIYGYWEEGKLGKALAVARVASARQPEISLWTLAVDCCEKAIRERRARP